MHVKGRVFAVHGDESFVADLPGQHGGFAFHVVQTQGTAGQGRVAPPQAAIGAVVHAMVAQIERREGHDAVVVDLALDGRAGFPHAGQHRWVRDANQFRGFLRREGFHRQGFGENFLQTGPRGRHGITQHAVNTIVVDEIPSPRQVAVDLLRDDPVRPGFGFVHHKGHGASGPAR
jgi:hypothetical protein